MTRIAGINVDDNKHLEIALTAIYGIGRSRAKQICHACNIDSASSIRNLNEEGVELLRAEIKKLVLEGDLRRLISTNIKRLMDINSYRGRRHRLGLPVRGQRTSSNAKTARKRKYIR